MGARGARRAPHRPAGGPFRLRAEDGTARPVLGPVILRADRDDPPTQLRADRSMTRDGDILHVGVAPLAKLARDFETFASAVEVPRRRPGSGPGPSGLGGGRAVPRPRGHPRSRGPEADARRHPAP